MTSQRKISDHHFENWSKTYERSLMQWFLFDRVHKAVLDMVPAEFRLVDILDLGSGTGRLLRRCSMRWPEARLFGVDPAYGMVEKARQLTPSATFFNSPAETLPLSDASIDLAFSTVSFHHWQDQTLGLRQVARVLRPGARFYLADLLAPFGFNSIFRHGSQPGATDVRALFEKAGLIVVTQRWLLVHGLLITVGEAPHPG